MKTAASKILLLNLLSVFSFTAYTQNNATDSLKVDSLKKVLQTQKEDTNKVNTLNALAMQVDDLKFVMRYATEAFSLAQKMNFKSGEARASWNIGYAHFHKGNYVEALIFFNTSLKISQAIDDKQGMFDAYRAIGDSYANQNNRSEAIKNYLVALNVAQKINYEMRISSR